ncbi:hypothetical protein AAF712_012204 [Marasmius tenuissimus]|uniref:Uncharacterized protein n=1 Tax=Marasmius tenuissimus TaxID=585030 RepID=A0ABR2ZI39_9AGAR
MRPPTFASLPHIHAIFGDSARMNKGKEHTESTNTPTLTEGYAKKFWLILSYNEIRYSINKLLSKWFDTPDKITAFRGIQALTQTIIGGSTARRFFDGAWEPSVLKLFVVAWRSPQLLSYLTQSGYTQTTSTTAIVYSTISRLLTFSQEGFPSIEVNVTRLSLVLPILEHPENPDMTFITASKAYHLYPNSCLEFRESVVNIIGRRTSPDDVERHAILDAISTLENDVKEAGYESYGEAPERELKRSGRWEDEEEKCTSPFSEFRPNRTVGDNRTMVVVLDTKDLQDALPSHVMYSTDMVVCKHSWGHMQTNYCGDLDQDHTLGRFCKDKDVLLQGDSQPLGKFCVTYDQDDYTTPDLFDDRTLFSV